MLPSVSLSLHTIKTTLRSILYYITGHGYGHAVRSKQVIGALERVAPTLKIHVRTTAPDWLFEGHSNLSYTRQAIDVGISQPNSLTMDLEATARACRKLHERLPELLEGEIDFIKQHGVDLIVADIPPAAFEIAARANIPSVAITNFTWDVIYRAYAEAHPEFVPLIEQMTGFYNKASLGLTLPYPCDTSMFRRRVAIPWISRVSPLNRTQARHAFDLPKNGTLVLLSFGGLGLDDLPWQKLNALTEFNFVTTSAVGHSMANLLVLDSAQRRYEDLLRAMNVIVTKPGYGIVADALSHQVPVLYTERGEFPEYPFLVRALRDLATAEFIPQHAVFSGEIRPYLANLLAKEPHWPATGLNGATVAAEKILALLDE